MKLELNFHGPTPDKIPIVPAYVISPQIPQQQRLLKKYGYIGGIASLLAPAAFAASIWLDRLILSAPEGDRLILNITDSLIFASSLVFSTIALRNMIQAYTSHDILKQYKKYLDLVEKGKILPANALLLARAENKRWLVNLILQEF